VITLLPSLFVERELPSMTFVSQPSGHEDAASVPALLATAYETLDDIVRALYEQAGRAGHLIAPFMVAAAAAADGRDAVIISPSLPPVADDRAAGQQQALGEASAADIADTLAEMARALSAQLAVAVGTAYDPRDREALATASRCAKTVHSCLAGTG
jgi:sirohydrochlorin ferrochelatase